MLRIVGIAEAKGKMTLYTIDYFNFTWYGCCAVLWRELSLESIHTG